MNAQSKTGSRFYSILSHSLEGRRGTTDEFATISFHLVLFSAAPVSRVYTQYPK